MVFMELFGLIRRRHWGVLLLPGDIFVHIELSPLLALGVPSGQSPPFRKTCVAYSVRMHTFVHVLLLRVFLNHFPPFCFFVFSFCFFLLKIYFFI